MAQQIINVGSAPNDRTGEPWRDAFIKVNENTTELYKSFSSCVLVVNSQDDFPVSDTVSVTLEAGVTYIQGCSFTMTKYFRAAGGSFVGYNSGAVVTYTGTAPMFDVNRSSLFTEGVTVSCPNANVFSLVGDGTGNIAHRLVARNIGIVDCVSFGSASQFTFISIDSVGIFDFSGSVGFSASGAGGSLWDFNLFSIRGLDSGDIGIDLGDSVIDGLSISGYLPVGHPDAIPLSGLANSGNIAAGFNATVTKCIFSNFNTPLQGVQVNDIQWDFFKNGGLPDSRNAADLYLSNEGLAGETVTVASSGEWYEVGVPVVTGSAWASDVLDRFTMSADGVLTYVGDQPIDAIIHGRATVEKVGGGSDELEVRLALNWSGLVTDGGLFKSRAVTDNTNPSSVPLGALVSMSPGDNIRTIYSNNGSSSNIIVSVDTIEVSD